MSMEGVVNAVLLFAIFIVLLVIAIHGGAM